MTVPVKARVFIDDDNTVTQWATVHAPDIVQRKVLVTELRKHVDLDAAGNVVAVDRQTGDMVPVPGVRAETPAATWHLDTDPGNPL